MDYSYFNDKKILIVVPHEDDEICLTGGLLASLNNKNIKIVYATNGNYIYKTKIRYKEAINSCKKLGIDKRNIIFLGYSDCPYDYDSHMYTSKVWIDRFNNQVTSGTQKNPEYCFSKFGIHNKFTKENLVKDIKSCILDFMPEIIIGIDLDFHPDHIMTSLCLERALGEIFITNLDYKPLILKGFAYENAYLGPNDFNTLNVREMFFKYDDSLRLCSNKYYSKDNEVNISLEHLSYTRNLLKNKLYKAVLKHKSQLLVSKSFSLINPNVKFWIRNTNNIINRAKVTVSSGNKKYLNDFLLCDSSNILNGNKKSINYDKGIWIPDKNDNKKEISISFNKETYINTLKLYNGNNNKKYINKLSIYIDNKENLIDYNNNLIFDFIIDKKVKNIKIKILDNVVENGFSEIELLDSNNLVCTSHKKIITDEHFSININYIINNILTNLTRIYRKIFLYKSK